MHLSLLQDLYSHSGPFLSVYVDTSRNSHDAEHALALRWRGLRESLEADGTDPATLDAVSARITETYVPGDNGHAIFAAGGEILLVATLPGPPRRESGRWSPLPHVMPLLAQRREAVPHVLVVADRIGADITVVGPTGEQQQRQVEGEDDPIRKVHAGGWSQRRFEQRAENLWEKNAAQVAHAVADAAREVGAAVVILAGEVRGLAELRSSFGADLSADIVEVSGGRAAGVDEEAFRTDVDKVLAEYAAAPIRRAVEDYRREEGQHGPVLAGLAPTLEALRRAQVATLLINDDPSADSELWIGPDPMSLAVDRQDLVDLGVAEPLRDRADAALARALVGTDADLVVVPQEELALPDGLGALLRYTDQSTSN